MNFLTAKQMRIWDERLENWASFMHDRAGGGAKISGCYTFVAHGARAEEDGIPGLLGQAMDINAIVLKLHPTHQRAVIFRYVSPLQDEVAAGEMGISRSRFVQLITHAKQALHILYLTQRFHVRPMKSARLAKQ